ncbi:winged helix-turn-helix domain-containing protein [Dyella japonica]|uniref:winged helix-turn-helix domain-containing protein n=1 Tax=Dyella japonica TaxID=231455 RepID=UPI0009E1F65B
MWPWHSTHQSVYWSMRFWMPKVPPVSREILIATLSDDPRHFDPHRLHMVVQRLRRKIHTLPQEDAPVLTIRGAGYLLASDKG